MKADHIYLLAFFLKTLYLMDQASKGGSLLVLQQHEFS
jgi:hypothetical protein